MKAHALQLLKRRRMGSVRGKQLGPRGQPPFSSCQNIPRTPGVGGRAKALGESTPCVCVCVTVQYGTSSSFRVDGTDACHVL